MTQNNDDNEDYWYSSDQNKRKNQLFNDDNNSKTVLSTNNNNTNDVQKNDLNVLNALDKFNIFAKPSSTTTPSSLPKKDTSPKIEEFRVKSLRASFKNDSSSSIDSLAAKNPQLQQQQQQREKFIQLNHDVSYYKSSLKEMQEKQDQPPDIPDTIQRIILNKPFWFDLYKSKTEKIRLLDEAIRSCDGNAILAVVLFIKRTLTPDIFIDILIQNGKQDALNQYLFYLEQINDFNELDAIYRKQGKTSEIAANAFRPIRFIDDDQLDKKLELLDNFKRSHQQTNAEFSLIVDKFQRLVSFQKNIDSITGDKISFKAIAQAKKQQSTTTTVIRHMNLNSSLDTVAHCLKNHVYLPKSNAEYSFDRLKVVFNLNDKQYAIVYIKAMADNYAWTEIERFTKPPSGLMSTIMKRNFDISWECVASIVHTGKAPQNVLEKYVRLISDPDTREMVAHKYKLHEIIVEDYKTQRNRQAIVQYRTKFQQNSTEYDLCTRALSDDTVKWK